jgi:hypothetical protein
MVSADWTCQQQQQQQQKDAEKSRGSQHVATHKKKRK